MIRIVLSLSAIALAVVAGCSTVEPVTPAPAPVVVVPTPAPVVVAPAATATPQVVVPTPTAVRAGRGRIESITAVPPSAAAGGSSLRRLGVKMDDGTVQYVDTAAQVSIGERIELTGDGKLIR